MVKGRGDFDLLLVPTSMLALVRTPTLMHTDPEDSAVQGREHVLNQAPHKTASGAVCFCCSYYSPFEPTSWNDGQVGVTTYIVSLANLKGPTTLVKLRHREIK